MTTGLSIVAIVIALVSLALTLRREWLDRVKLQVSANPMTSPNGHGEIVAIVENHGRQPALVKGIGFEWKVRAGVLPGNSTGSILFNDPWARVRLDPGSHHELRWQPDRLHCHADMPMRTFVEFGDHRRTYSKPLDPFRLLLVLGWVPPMTPPSEWLEAPAGTVRAEPVVPSWKRWMPRDQRMATPAPAFEHSREELAEIRRRVLDKAGQQD
jgi:hypothetical protein